MTVTTQPFNQTLKLLLNKEVDFTSLKWMLLDSVTVFDATYTSLSQLAGAPSPHRAREVYGHGWTEGGEAVSGVAVTTVLTSGAMIDANDVVRTAVGASIGPARAAVLFDDASAGKNLLVYLDFGRDEEAGEDTDFIVALPTTGLQRTIWV